MQKSTTLPNDLQPVDPQQETQAALGSLLERISFIVLTLGTLALIASGFRIAFLGWHPNILTDLLTYPFIIIPILFRKKLPTSYVIAIILAVTSLNGISNFATLGLATLSAVILVSNTGIACIAFGNRYGIWHAAVSIAGIALIGLGIGTGILPHPSVPVGYLDAPQTWILQIILLTFSAGMLITAVSCLQTRLTGSINHVIKLSTALKDSDHQYRRLALNMNEVIFTRNIDLNVTYASPSVAGMFGYQPEDIPESLQQLMTPESQQQAKEKFAKLDNMVKTGQGTDMPLMEFQYVRKDGSKFWGEIQPKVLNNAVDHPVGFQGIIRDISARKSVEESLRQAVKDKDVLLRELHHRTKNNMQVIYSMLGMQAGTIKDPTAAGILEDIQGRLLSMSLVHQKLYDTGNLSHINFSDYSRELFDLLLQSYRKADTDITFECVIGDMEMTIETAIPCGLILNELIMNSVKYAFPDYTDGKITITATRTTGNTITLTYRDNGIGLPDGYDISEADSFGFKIVSTIAVHQLGGSIELIPTPGFGCTITFVNTHHTGEQNGSA